MITLIDGKPGSGKSYYMVREIALKNKDYFKVFTNIDNFTFKVFDNVDKFKLSIFESLMSEANLLFNDEECSDEDILNLLMDKSFLSSVENEEQKPVLICIDEVHNILSRSNNLWTWILTYHRHLYIDFIFATQDAALIHTTYNKLFQKIYRALPADRNIFSLFGKVKSNRYQEHLKIPIYDGKNGTFIKNIYIKREDKFYALYKAGDEVRSKSIFSRFIYTFILFFVLVIVGFISFLFYLTSDADKAVEESIKEEKEPNYKQIIKKNIISQNDIDLSTSTYLTLNCINDTCINKTFNISLFVDDLNQTVVTTNSKFLTIKNYSSNLGYVSILASQDFINLFQGANNENKKDNSSFTILH